MAEHPTSILVTGGTGFLGSHLIRVLRGRYSSSLIYSLDIHQPVNERYDGVEYHTVDITDFDKVWRLVEQVKPAIVFHVASALIWMQDKAAIFKINVGGTQNLLEVCQDTGVRVFIYTSSSSVVSDNVSDLAGADETWPYVEGRHQSSVYTESKIHAEKLVLAANDRTKMLTSIIRPCGVFGPYDGQTFAGLVTSYKKGATRLQFGNNKNLYDFTYVDNCVEGHLLAGSKLLQSAQTGLFPPEQRKVDAEAFVITNDEPLLFYDFTRKIYRLLGANMDEKPIVIPRFLALFLATIYASICSLIGAKPVLNPVMIRFTTMVRYFSIQKAKTRLGYKPLCSIDEGIEQTVEWYKNFDGPVTNRFHESLDKED
ncbi:hypothetical protein F5884DRAFT_809405 [Xylogone sp. PMI_703]|nr:hypothetical protein F5884DRAFT_809405 [Xylogone sp. PMI_703]